MINYFAWLVVGAAIGAAFGIMRQLRHQDHDFRMDIFFGVAAAAVGGLLLSPLLGVGTRTGDGFGFGATLIATVSALAALGGVTYSRYRAAR